MQKYFQTPVWLINWTRWLKKIKNIKDSKLQTLQFDSLEALMFDVKVYAQISETFVLNYSCQGSESEGKEKHIRFYAQLI